MLPCPDAGVLGLAALNGFFLADRSLLFGVKSLMRSASLFTFNFGFPATNNEELRAMSTGEKGQAMHWFDLDKFYAEVKRVLKRNGVLATYGYVIPVCDNPQATQHIKKVNAETLIFSCYV